MSDLGTWQPIETAPKDKHVILYADQIVIDGNEDPRWFEKLVLTGYWDDIDEAWCSEGSTWLGPFFKPTHWMPLPEPPTAHAGC